MLPFDFTVEGPPLSHQTKSKTSLQEWQASVRAAAAKLWGKTPPLTVSLRIALTYFHDGSAVLLDNDNMLKPIQDALNGLVYADDRLITDTAVRKTGIGGAFVVRGAPPILLSAFSVGKPFLHVRVGLAPSHANLLL